MCKKSHLFANFCHETFSDCLGAGHGGGCPSGREGAEKLSLAPSKERVHWRTGIMVLHKLVSLSLLCD
jgi:hypothetical protein